MTNDFIRDGVGVTDPVLADSGATYTPGISERRGGVTSYLHSGLKNADAQSGSSQTISASRKYDAWGNVRSSTGTWQGPFGHAGGFGYQANDRSGLQLLGHRYYDPETGRFLTRDPIKDGRNWHAYGGGLNIPITGADPAGLEWHDPGVVYVDPGFKGTVIVVGESDNLSGTGFSNTIVPGGHHSHPGMDVDYVIIIYPDGRKEVYFLMGDRNSLFPGDNVQHFSIDANGNVSGSWLIFGEMTPLSDLTWEKNLDQGLSRPVPADRKPIKGKPRPGMRPVMRPKPKPGPRPPISVPSPRPSQNHGTRSKPIWD